MELDDDSDFMDSASFDALSQNGTTSIILSSDEEDTLPVLLKKKRSNDSLKTSSEGLEGGGAASSQNLESLARGLASRIDQISKLHEFDDKCSSILGKGTVLDHTQNVILKHEVIDETIVSAEQSPETLNHVNVEVTVSSLKLPHGTRFFVKAVDFVDTLGIPDTLRGMSSDARFVGKVPPDVIFWLLELSCLSRNHLTRQSAFTILMQNLQQNKTCMPSLIMCYSHVAELLVKLGAKVDDLTTFSQFEPTDFVHSEEEVEVLLSSIKHIASFLKFVCLSLPRDKLFKLRNYLTVLITIALDKTVSKAVSHIRSCLEVLLSVASDEEAREVFCDAVSVHWNLGKHGNCVFLLRLLPVTTLELRSLKRQIVKQFLLLVTESIGNDVKDHDLSLSILQHYIQKESNDIDYYEMHSVLTVLGIFVKQPDMKWDLLKNKSLFLDNLSYLATKKIKENVNQVGEQGPVKDLIIYLKLDLERENGKESMQTNLFDYFMEPQD
uniref:Uncharacterized protein n=1 Tax=Amphimedon queenslandica TaxID=400682 RepID=A0A1X7V902_AMPQE